MYLMNRNDSCSILGVLSARRCHADVCRIERIHVQTLEADAPWWSDKSEDQKDFSARVAELITQAQPCAYLLALVLELKRAISRCPHSRTRTRRHVPSLTRTPF